jgi:hypothetical protein
MILQTLAQVAGDLSPIAGQGLLGAVFAWLALRLEKKVDKMTDSNDWLCTLLMMDLSTRDNLGIAAKKVIRERLSKAGVKNDE